MWDIFRHQFRVGPRQTGSTRSPNAQALPAIVSAGPIRRHPHWRESGAPRASAPFAGFLSVGWVKDIIEVCGSIKIDLNVGIIDT